LRIRVIVVGRLKEKYLQAAEAEYIKRLGRLCKLEVREVADEAALIKAIGKEGPGAKLCLLDERGELLTSEDFAQGILAHHQMHGGGGSLIFAIGGADGHSEALRGRADRLIAFGRLTIAHRLVRILLAEQIYRGLSILAGMPYHRA